MSNQDIFEDIISVLHRTSNPHAASSRYRVMNNKVLQVAITLEYSQ